MVELVRTFPRARQGWASSKATFATVSARKGTPRGFGRCVPAPGTNIESQHDRAAPNQSGSSGSPWSYHAHSSYCSSNSAHHFGCGPNCSPFDAATIDSPSAAPPFSRLAFPHAQLNNRVAMRRFAVSINRHIASRIPSTNPAETRTSRALTLR